MTGEIKIYPPFGGWHDFRYVTEITVSQFDDYWEDDNGGHIRKTFAVCTRGLEKGEVEESERFYEWTRTQRNAIKIARKLAIKLNVPIRVY